MPLAAPALAEAPAVTLEVVLAAAGLLATILLWVVDRRIRKIKITYRVHLDTALDLTPSDAVHTFELEVRRRDGEEVRDASIVLVRIRNQGNRDLTVRRGSDEDSAETSGWMRLLFPGRSILTADFVTATSEGLLELIEKAGLDHRADELTLPRTTLKSGDSYKVLVLLQGQVRGVRGQAYISGADFVPDPGRIAPSNRTLALGGAVVLFAGLLGGLVWNQWRTPPDLCVPGQLTVEGSTAFEPLMTDIAARYEDACRGAEIEVIGTGSLEGVENLVADAGADPDVARGRLAMSDVEVDYADLVGEQVGALLFTFVVNKETGIRDLTTEQLRGIYAGEYRTWAEVDPVAGAEEPIVLVSRDAQSGTRATVERRILARGEGAVTSDDCLTPRPVPGQGDGLPLRCEQRETSQVLAEVDTNSGALGYAQLSDLLEYENVVAVRIDGVEASVDAIRDGTYDLWSREQLYTYGVPSRGTLLHAFLEFVTQEYLPTPEAQQRLQDNGFLPLTSG